MSVSYAFTVTLRSKLYADPAEVQYDKTYKEVLQILNAISSQFTLVAELTKAFNVHYHGVISWASIPKGVNLRKKFTDAFRPSKQIGYVNIKQIENDAGWNEYITKSLVETRDSLSRPPIVHDWFNICTSRYSDFVLHSGMMQYDDIIEQ